MSPERWQQISQLFKAALEQKPAQRHTLLMARCAGDSGLCSEVEELLASYEAAESSWLQPFVPALGLLPEDNDEPSLVGRRIGHYEITHEIGHGGMGAVYAAHRADDEYKKRVAIKLVKRGLDTREVLKRFRYERQILASLDHPNIARLLDGGTTDDGRPYFVLEYVEGQPLTGYCETHNLSLTERLELFREVCAAVSYAHQNLVVHRDLKPDNILVAADGTPKLLDFGIAKLLRPDFFPDTVIPTGLAVRPMTPDYASPEQVRGQPITTASDVYSLGVVLYELLTGHKPYSLGSYTPQEIERVICEEEPRRPSLAITDPAPANDNQDTPAGGRQTHQKPQVTQRSLSGDVDNILLMALRKEPNRRYASAEQFSEDVRRYLNGLPVVAHKDTLAYRSRKFITRHKIGVLAITVLAVLILSFAVFARIQATRTARERDRAARISAFLVEIFRVTNPNETQGNAVTARELLDQSAARITNELQNEPGLQAALLDTMGQAYENIGLLPKALPLLEQSLALRRQVFGANAPEVAETLTHLGSVHWRRQDYVACEAAWREALTVRRKAFGANSAEAADSLNDLGKLFWSKQDYAAAEPCFRETLAIRRQVYGPEHPSVAKSTSNLAVLLSDNGNNEAAAPLYREAIALHRKLKGGEHPDTLSIMDNFAGTLILQGRLAEAGELRQEVLAGRRRAYGNQHSSVAQSLTNVAEIDELKKDYASAGSRMREALEINRKMQVETNIAFSCLKLGELYISNGDIAAAEPLVRESLALRRKLFPEENRDVANAQFSLGILLREKNNLAESEALLRQALQTSRKLIPADQPELGWAMAGLGLTLLHKGAAQEAEPLLREGLAKMKNSGWKDYWITAETQSALGECLTVLRRYEEAEPLLTESYAQLQERIGTQRQFRIERGRQRLAKLSQARGQTKAI